MEENRNNITVSEAMETMSDKDLVFIATYNPPAFKTMCSMWGLEMELEKEGKLHRTNIRKPKKGFVYSWYKLKKWLFSKLLKMVLKR